MSRLLLLILCICFSFSAQSQYRFLSPFNSLGVPAQMNHETVSSRMLANITASLPESKPVPVYNPQYIAGVDTDIKLMADAEVWVTFVAEGAGYKNVLGYYTYSLSNPPASAPAASEITIVFANVSAEGSGGGLHSGDQIYLGKFPANTGIGWVLIADGFRNGGVTNGNWVLYSTPAFNPEGNPSLKYHNVLLRDDSEQKVVLSFEDIRRDYGNCDQDFNDAVFFITVSPNTALTSNINRVTESTGAVNTGGEGGLESEGSLADKIATRHFQHQRTTQPDYDHPQATASLTGQKRQARVAGNALMALLPETPFENSVAYVSTPGDLLNITNAKDVFAVDYFVNNNRVAAALATYTEGQVYNHTKTICDRLNGGSVLDIKTVAINGGNFTLTKLKQPDQQIEYAICFSVSDESDRYTAESNWTIDRFATGKNYINFQVWASNPTDARVVVENILVALARLKPVSYSAAMPAIPQVFVQSGYYKDGKLILTIRNNAKASRLSLNGSLKRTETNRTNEDWHTSQALNQQVTQTIDVSLNQFFDTGLTLTNDQHPATDVLYLADSPWGIDATQDATQISDFQVVSAQNQPASDAYMLERNASVKANVKKYLSVFRLLKPSAQAMNMTGFGGIQFEASGKGIWQLVLLKKSITNFDDQFRFDIQVEADAKTISIPYENFRSTVSRTFDASDLTGVVFSFQGNNRDFKPVELTVSSLRFSKSMPTDAETKAPAPLVNVYPNPTAANATASFELTSATEVVISLVNVAGQVIWQTVHQGQMGPNEETVPLADLPAGTYLYGVSANGQRTVKKLVLVK